MARSSRSPGGTLCQGPGTFRLAAPALGLVLCLAILAVPVAAGGQDLSAADLASVKAEYRRPPPLPVANPDLVSLGRDLFWDPRVSASGKTACVMCHLPELGWATRDATSVNDSGKPTSRKSQTLLGVGYAADKPNGWDGRNATLAAQARGSILSGSMSLREAGTPVNNAVIEQRIIDAPGYVLAFQKALPGRPIQVETIAEAIATFERHIEPGIAPFDRWIEGDDTAIDASAQRGFVLFNTKANCSVCHSGWRFTDDGFHDIGTSTTDLGRGRELKDVEAMQFAFKTPTLRSVALRPPYMHNGMARDLQAVLRFYETGGINRPSRSLDMHKIALTDQERRDLVAFMETLTAPEPTTVPVLPAPR